MTGPQRGTISVESKITVKVSLQEVLSILGITGRLNIVENRFDGETLIVSSVTTKEYPTGQTTRGEQTPKGGL